MDRSFTTAELAKILNQNVRFVIDWTEYGLFRADIQPASGHGSRRAFSYASVLRAKLALFLHDKFGFNRRFYRPILKDIFDNLEEKGFFVQWAAFKEPQSESEGKTGAKELYQNGCQSLILTNTDGETLAVWYPEELYEAIQTYFTFFVLTGYRTTSLDFIGIELRPIKEAVDRAIAEL